MKFRAIAVQKFSLNRQTDRLDWNYYLSAYVDGKNAWLWLPPVMFKYLYPSGVKLQKIVGGSDNRAFHEHTKPASLPPKAFKNW